MKLIYIISLAFLSTINVNAKTSFKQHNISFNDKVDSFFCASSKAIHLANRKKAPLSKNGYRFIFLLKYMSGIPVVINSSWGHSEISNTNLLQLESWYESHKNKIEWQKVTKGLHILNSPNNPRELSKLRIY